MTTKEDLFPSKYLKATNLGGQSCAVKIKSASVETLKDMRGGENRKCVVYFVGAKKSLPLNLTNFCAIADICGDDTDMWPGREIELYPARVQMAGETVDAIRVRRPAAAELSLRSSPRTPAPKSVGLASATPVMEDEDDMADSIPF